MKKALILILSLLILVQTIALGEAGRIILLTDYCQIGWGESYTLGAVDEQGNLYVFSSDSWQDIPFSDDAFPEWVQSSADLQQVGTLASQDLFDLKGMVSAVQAQEVTYTSAACDAGCQRSYAYRYDRNGQAEAILLGVSGDEVFENTDPAAQALYSFLRKSFPDVTAFDGQPGMSPAGFQPVPLMTFAGYAQITREGLSLTAWYNDCESGLQQITPALTMDELMSMTVTGKKNCNSVTGNTVIYRLTDSEGNDIAKFEFYKELLVMPDGMYTVQ